MTLAVMRLRAGRPATFRTLYEAGSKTIRWYRLEAYTTSLPLQAGSLIPRRGGIGILPVPPI